MNAYEILRMITIEDEFNPFKDPKFVNEVFIPKALKYCSNPKQNISEGGALMISVLYT